MELLRTAVTPMGDSVPVGIGRDLMLPALWASAAFVVAHFVWAWQRRVASKETTPPGDGSGRGGLPRRILRHTATARAFHWVMAAAMLVLLLTALVPALGLDLPWVTLHWSVGLLLFFAVAWHLIHAMGWQDFWAMWIVDRDVRDGIAAVRRALAGISLPAPRTGKYTVAHKVFHNVVALATVGAIATGLLMMARVETPLWPARPGLFSDAAWGWIYLAHGLSSVCLIGMMTGHVYFALRPENRWLNGSMVRGWITRERYLTHHDPQRWSPAGASSPEAPAGGAVAEAAVQSAREDL